MHSDLIGRIVGSYRIEAKIGAGGMGEVFQAHDSKLERPVALKLLPAGVACDPDRLRRFLAEARAASSITVEPCPSVRPRLITKPDRLLEGRTRLWAPPP